MPYQECLNVEIVDKKCIFKSADYGSLRSITNMENVKKFGELDNVTIIREKLCRFAICSITTCEMGLRKSVISGVFDR